MAAPKSIVPIAQERPFAIFELFFSTTDQRGVIRYGNEVFSRIAGYPLADMVGKPHNLIRHPDMPKAVFRLVWDYLHRGRTVAGYVKNMASDGRYYWVLAIIMPCGDGYLSVRLKPSSDVFAVVQGAYAKLLQVEQEATAAGASPKEAMDASAGKLMELLASLGFPSYDEFMWAALTAEMTSRSKLLAAGDSDGTVTEPGRRSAKTSAMSDRERLLALFARSQVLDRQLGDLFARPGTFSQLRNEIIPKANFIVRIGSDIRVQSINAQIEASRLGESARALAMVAERLGKHAGEGIATVEELNGRLRKLTTPIAELIFNSMVSKIQIEMAASFVREILATADDAHGDAERAQNLATNLQLLFRSFLDTARRTPAALQQLQGELARVGKEIQELCRFMRTLHFIYFTGKVETARQNNSQSFITIFDQIKAMIHESDTVLSQLQEQIIASNSVRSATSTGACSTNWTH